MRKRFVLNLLFFILVFTIQSAGQMRQVFLEPGHDYKIIRKISFYSPSHGYIASTDVPLNWVGYTADSGRTFVKRHITLGNVNFNSYTVNITFGFGLNGVKAFSQDTIIAYGDYGLVPAILYSTNGGLSYSLVYHSQYNSNQLSGGITDMVFPENNNIGYAVDADRILKTTNKGLSWSVVRTDPDSYFEHLDAVDNNNLIAFSNLYHESKLLKTSNAGNTWQSLNLPGPTVSYSTFLTANKGWLSIGDNNDSLKLFYTSNGGSSWSQKNNAEITPFYCFKMKFVNDSTGFATQGYFSTYKTTDSGKVWQPLPRDNNYSFFGYYHFDMQVLNENQLWCGGAQDFLELSTNGGGQPLPKAFFKIDTTNVFTSNTVNLLNFSKPGYQFKWYVNNNLISTAYNTTYTHNVFSPVDSIVLIVTSGSLSDTLKKYQYFSVPNLPTITSFFPVTGSPGTVVTINGSHFTGVTAVTFGGVPPASYSIVSNTVITVIIGNGSTGTVSVNNSFGGYSLPGFTYFPSPSSPPPVITSFSPVSGPVGTVVTISGTGFAATVADNVVYFGAVKGSVTSATSNQIICTVPAGASYEPFTVLNKSNNLSGQSFKPFGLTFADSSNFTSHSFINRVNFSYSPQKKPRYVMSKDIDDDGKPDLIGIIVHIGLVDSMIIYRNYSIDSLISFGPRINISAVNTAVLDINDIDGDQKPDIITSPDGNDPAIFRNTSVPGTISFANPYSLTSVTSGNQGIAIADLNNDGKNDIALAAFSSKNIAVIKNTSVPGFLSFGAEITYPVINFPTKIAAGDLDGDGKKDLVSYNYTSSGNTDFTCFKNTTDAGAISFAPGFNITVPGSTVSSGSLIIVDYDTDEKLDILIFNDLNYCFYRNITTGGTITFAPVVTIPITTTGYSSLAANLSGDRKPDVLIGNTWLRYFRLIRNTSIPGSIVNDNTINVEGNPLISMPEFTNTADFNLDGKMDIITSSAQDNLISIFENRIGEPIPFSESTICAGSTKQQISDVAGTNYQWQQNTGSGFVNISDNSSFSGTQTSSFWIMNIPLTWNGYSYRCVVDGNLYSSIYELKVNATLVPSASISTPSNTICSGATVVFSTTGTNISPATTYTWQVNGITTGTNLPTFTTNNLTNGSQVRVIVFNPCSAPNSTISNVITMTVNGEVPSVGISTPSTTICNGTNTTFTATPVNPGTSPVYQWQVNGVNVGTNSPTYSTNSLNTNDQVKVFMTAVSSCASYPPVTSNTLTITSNTPATPLVTISTAGTTVCQGYPITFSAVPANGGTSPSYQWQVNGVNTGTNSSTFNTTALTNGSQVKVIMTSNSNCVTAQTATSNIITMTVTNPVAPDISINGNTTVTTGQSTTLSSTIANGGSSPAYKWEDSTGTHSWQSITGATSASIGYSPAQTGNKIRCILTAFVYCVSPSVDTSNSLAFTVSAVTGINPISGNNYGIKFYPNPVRGSFFIDSLQLSDKWQKLDLFSNDGKKLITTLNITGRRSVTLDISRLPAGQFIAVLRRKSGAPVYLKFIKL